MCFKVADHGFDSCSSSELLAFLSSLVLVVGFQWLIGSRDGDSLDLGLSFAPSVINNFFWKVIVQLLHLVQKRFNGRAVMRISFKGINSQYDQFPGVDGKANLVSKFVLLVCLAFSNTGCEGFMKALDLVLIGSFLVQCPLE